MQDTTEEDKLSPVSTHSRPKAAAFCCRNVWHLIEKFQHTAARRRLLIALWLCMKGIKFQHTAARRRLQGELLL